MAPPGPNYLHLFTTVVLALWGVVGAGWSALSFAVVLRGVGRSRTWAVATLMPAAFAVAGGSWALGLAITVAGWGAVFLANRVRRGWVREYENLLRAYGIEGAYRIATVRYDAGPLVFNPPRHVHLLWQHPYLWLVPTTAVERPIPMALANLDPGSLEVVSVWDDGLPAPRARAPQRASGLGQTFAVAFDLMYEPSYAVRVEFGNLADRPRALALRNELAHLAAFVGAAPAGPGGLVRNLDELHDVVVDSLRSYAVSLIGPHSTVETLWDQPDRRVAVWRPKREAVLADVLAHHLRGELVRRGVAVTREAQVYRRPGADAGQRLDIAVTAIAPARGGAAAAYTQLTLTVEVKPQWSREFYSALRDQLVGRYLRDQDAPTVGVYCAAFYYCTRWDPSDKNREEAERHGTTPEQVARRLAARAAELSVGGRRVTSVLLNAALP